MVPIEQIPLWLIYTFSAAIGLIVGSYLNVAILRLPLEKSTIWPGSRCPKCKRKIAWYDNIPVLSWILLAAKCRKCRQPISVRYPLIELGTALLFVIATMHFGFSLETIFRDWVFIAILVAVTFTDIDTRLIPDELSIGGMVYGLATAFMDTNLTVEAFFDLLRGLITLFTGAIDFHSSDLGWLSFLKFGYETSPVLAASIGAFLGFGVFYGFAYLYFRLTKKMGLGGGDIKFLGAVGAFLGPDGVAITIILSSIVGSLVGVGWALATRQKSILKVAIPYGPFLVLGAFIFLFFGWVL